MKIDNNKLETKYALDIYRETDDFPTNKDLTYILIRFLDDNDLLDKSFTAENLWSSMKTCLGTIDDLRMFLDSLSKPLEETFGKNINIILNIEGKDKKGNLYKLINNPWS